MAMYRYFQTEEDGPWQPITDSPTALEDAKRQGAKKMTILAVDSPLGADDAKRGHKYVGPLYFDVDCADVADAIKSAQQLVSILTSRYDCPEAAIHVYCSGKKGLHVLVDQRAFMSRVVAIKDLPLIYKLMASELYVPGLDLAPYACGRNNTFRIANVKRYDGNYRVPLRLTELMSLTAEAYRELVARPRHEVAFQPYKGDYSVKLNVLYSTCQERLGTLEQELTERSRELQVQHLKLIQSPPPCVIEIAEYKGIKETATFNAIALNLGLWASRAGAEDHDRERIFAMTADNAPKTDRYPTPRSRQTELEGKFKFVSNSPDYKFGCGAMRSLLKRGRSICNGCPMENACAGKSDSEFASEMATQLGIAANEDGYQKYVGKGRYEQISTFLLEAQSAFIEDSPDGTGRRRRGTLCRVKRGGAVLGTVIMEESAWLSKAAFLRALEGLSGVYYVGGDAEIQKIKLLVFAEEENMPEINQVTAAGIHIEQEAGTTVITYVEPGKSLNSLSMVDTHRLVKNIVLPPNLFAQTPLVKGDKIADRTLAALCEVNTPATTALGVGWTVACHFKQHLRACFAQFPLLSLWGGAGAGKSKFAELLACLHGMDCNLRSKANMAAMNRFNAIELLSGTTTCPRLCEEYNPGKMPEAQYVMLGEFFKALWNSEATNRGTLQPGSQRAVSVEIPLTAPAILLSEQQIKMPALRERTLVVKMTKQGRRREPFMEASAGKTYLMRFGQQLMQKALRTSPEAIGKLLNLQYEFVGEHFDDRPRYSLAVVFLGLHLMAELAKEMDLKATATAVGKLRSALITLVTPQEEEEEAASGQHLTSILGGSDQTEIDVMVQQIVSLAIESGAGIYERMNDGHTQRQIWLKPETDYQVSGDKLYLWGKTCHNAFLSWARHTGTKTPLQTWSDVRQLIESEPYFIGWISLPGFAFGEPALCLDMAVLRRKGVNVDTLYKVFDTFRSVELS